MYKCFMPEGEGDQGRCPNFAQYEARLDWTEGRMFVCAYHARMLRKQKEVISMKTLKLDDDGE